MAASVLLLHLFAGLSRPDGARGPASTENMQQQCDDRDVQPADPGFHGGPPLPFLTAEALNSLKTKPRKLFSKLAVLRDLPWFRVSTVRIAPV